MKGRKAVKRTVRIKRSVEVVSGRVFDRDRLEISIKTCDGHRFWFVCRDRADFDAVFEFLKIEEEVKDEYYRKYH